MEWTGNCKVHFRKSSTSHITAIVSLEVHNELPPNFRGHELQSAIVTSESQVLPSKYHIMCVCHCWIWHQVLPTFRLHSEKWHAFNSDYVPPSKEVFLYRVSMMIQSSLSQSFLFLLGLLLSLHLFFSLHLENFLNANLLQGQLVLIFDVLISKPHTTTDSFDRYPWRKGTVGTLLAGRGGDTYNLSQEDNIFASDYKDSTWNVAKLLVHMYPFYGSMQYQVCWIKL